MCGSRTVTTALERGREGPSKREGGRTGVVMMLRDESGGERNFMSLCASTEGTVFANKRFC